MSAPFTRHCNVGTGKPETDALNVALLLWMTVWFARPVMPGATSPDETVSVMLFVITPAELLATSEYVPLSGACALLIVSVLVALPETVEPLPVAPSDNALAFRHHRNAGVGTPETVAGIVTVLPTAAA
jgi:hypothetical protein